MYGLKEGFKRCYHDLKDEESPSIEKIFNCMTENTPDKESGNNLKTNPHSFLILRCRRCPRRAIVQGLCAVFWDESLHH